jgi:hypothetical protein
MHKRRHASSAFNPEKFLAADLKKKAAEGSHAATVSIGPPLIVLADYYKDTLGARLRQERPELLIGELDFAKSPALVAEIAEFLKRSFAKDKLKVSTEIFGMLLLDFLRELSQRRLEG